MNRKIRLRSLMFGGLFTLFFIGLLARVYWVQVVEASSLLTKAERQWETDKVLDPKRGTILDRNDKVLAEDAAAYTVAVNPKTIAANHLENKIADGLTDILGKPDDPGYQTELRNKIMEEITRKKKDGINYYTEVEVRNEGWKIDSDTADKIKAMNQALIKDSKAKDIGVYLKDETKRSYPNNRLASQLLGYTDKEGKPVIGLEAYYNDLLQGTPGSLSYQRDLEGVQLPNSKTAFTPAVDGKDLRLTIDKNIQFFVERALRKVYDQFHPRTLIGIAADPNTMEILGMVSLPDFDPNRYWEAGDQRAFNNNAVAAQFEPGSTFKLVSLAGAVEEGIFDPNAKYQSGSIKVPGRTLHDYNISGWGKITYLEGLKRSSNVAFVKLGYEQLGEDKLMDYITRFGFGRKTGIDIAGELPGVVKMKYPSEFATATYGQGLTVTAIQETAAYAAIANGGKLMSPHVVKQVLDPKTHEPVQTFEPTVVRQVVSEATAKKVSSYLEQVVSDKELGTGRNAAVDGYRVAGKTGTANLVDPGGSGYVEGKWVTSFIGYAPVEDPKLLVTIIAVEPELHGDFHLGSNVAPPAFKEIVSESLRYMGVPSNNQQQDVAQEVESKSVAVPDLAGMSPADAGKKAKETGLAVQSFGKGASIIRQYPAPGTQIGSNERIYVVTQEEGDFPYPNLTGKSLRDALEICSFLHIPCSTTGEGYVTDQAVGEPNENGVKPLELTLVSASEAATQARGKQAEADTNKTNKGPTNSGGTANPTKSANPKNATNPVKAANSTGPANTANSANTANRSSKPPAH